MCIHSICPNPALTKKGSSNIVSYNVHTCTRPFSFERVSLDIRPWGRGEGGGRQTVPILSPGMVMDLQKVGSRLIVNHCTVNESVEKQEES